MNRTIGVVFVLVILAGSLAAYLYWQQEQSGPAPELAQVAAPPPPLEPPVHQVVEAAQPLPELPMLAASDSFVLNALAGLVGNSSLMKAFRSDRIIHNIVATIDNLPRMRAPMSVMPIRPAPGMFITTGTEANLAISPDNAARYASYMKIAGAMDSKQLVELYVRLYPLFQQSYEELGYPNKYFNDRLIEAIDDLMAAPDIKEPVRLARPGVLYEYADPGLEGRSIGQRILMRTGSRNEAAIKAKLGEIRQELKLHMHEQKLQGY